MRCSSIYYGEANAAVEKINDTAVRIKESLDSNDNKVLQD